MSSLHVYVLCCVGVLSLIARQAACETMYFQPTNVEQPSLFQTMELRFVGWSALDGDPTVQNGDFMYIIDSTATSCATIAPSSENRFSVHANTAQNVATVELVASPTVFTVGFSYAACYVSANLNEAFVILRKTIDQGNLVEVPFTATAAIYQSMSISPTTVYAGQGLITVVIIEDDQRSNGRPLNQGVLTRPFFLPCGTSCGSYAALASMCSSATGVTLSSIDGYTTITLTGTFTAPLQPAAGYALCVPYCYSASAGCSQVGYTMAWTVVTSTTVVFQSANPSSYFMDPMNPTVRMRGSANVTGAGLTTNDRVKIVVAGSSCSSPDAALMSNVNYNQAVVWQSTTDVAVPFTSLSLIGSSISGQLCYARGANPTIFAPVFLTGSSASDFVINPMQPTQFTVDPPAPSLGQSFSITFTGADLSASADNAFLVTSSSSSCSVTDASSDLCDGTTLNPTYTCVLSGGSAPSCVVAVDADTNAAATLCVCYRLPRSNNYGMVSGSISLSARNPVYTLSPYPFYEGQEATMTFSGSGISFADTVRFVAAHDSCDGIPVTNVTAYNGQSHGSTSSVFNIVGPGSLCLRVCYRFSGSSSWVTSRPTTAISVDASCPSTHLYITPFNMRYVLSPSSVYARATISVTFSGSATTLVAFKVVPAVAVCVISNCGSGPACVQAALAADYFSSVSSSAATFAISRSGDQVLCVSLGSSFVPVLGATTGVYTFTSVPENPSSFSIFPALWRVGMSNLSASFAGTALNVTSASNDILRALDSATLLSSKGVCPVEASSVSVILTSTATVSSGTTAVTFALRGADTLVASTSVQLCYYRGASGSRIASYLGAVVVGGQNPASMTATGSLRAGEVVSLSFNASATASLFSSTDTLLFFQFQQSSIAPTCRCDATSCATAISNTTSTIVMSGSSSLSTWRSPLGFDNFAARAVYVVCYTVASSGSPTYVGQLPIAESHPSYYTLGSTVIRVGLPVVITVATLCMTCVALSSMDDIIIVQNITHCADVSSMNASQAEELSPVSYTAPNTQRTLVPLQEGFYRVCYKKHNTSQYQELAFSSQLTRAPLTVTPADPASFAPTPASPTAGQYMIISLTSCTATVCGTTCGALRIVRGTGASCWNTSLTAYASQSCVGTSTVYQFPNQFFTEGAYTVCFGDSAVSRVPGTLTIAAANPSHYNAMSTSVFANQGSKATLTLFGSALSATDMVFLLPSVTYSCHDLRDPQLDIRQNATYAGWWHPSVDAYPIILTSSSVATWVASDSFKRFSADIVSSSKFCSNTHSMCSLQLCYLRAGTSWAPVSMQTSTTMSLFPANPKHVIFDVSSTPRVTQYVLATVTGTGLTTSDTFYLADGFCDQGVVLARTVSVASTNGTTWRGVIRFTSRNSGTVSACYTSGVTTTQILDAPIIFSIAAPLYYVKRPTWNESQRAGAAGHALTQYESVYIAGTTSSTGSSQIMNVASMYVVSQSDECNYEAFPLMALAMQNRFDRVVNQTSYFLGRLYQSGSFALCLNTSGLLFKIVGSSTNISATSIVVQSPNPSAYVLNPVTPFVDQIFTVTFQFGASGFFEQQNVTGDSVHLIQGGLQSCGFSNVSTEVISLGAGGVGTHIISSANIASNWTVCYRTYNGSFATVPRNGLTDRNFELAARYPRYFSTMPQQPQTTVSLDISFYSNGTGPLSPSDRAYLVLKDDSSAAPSSLDCTATPALSADMISVTGMTSTWSISSTNFQLQPGTYSVCYVVASNGKGSIVDLSGYLVIVPRQTPHLDPLPTATVTSSKSRAGSFSDLATTSVTSSLSRTNTFSLSLAAGVATPRVPIRLPPISGSPSMTSTSGTITPSETYSPSVCPRQFAMRLTSDLLSESAVLCNATSSAACLNITSSSIAGSMWASSTDGSVAAYSLTATQLVLAMPATLQIPFTLPFPWVFRLPAGTANTTLKQVVPDNGSSADVFGNISYALAAAPTVGSVTTVRVEGVCTAGGLVVTVLISVQWPQQAKATVTQAAEATTITSTAVSIGLGGVSTTTTSSTVILTVLTCAEDPPLSTLMFVVSVFFGLGPAAVAVGNVGLVLGVGVVQAAIVFFLTDAPDRSLGSLRSSLARARCPSLTIKVMGMLLPGSVLGSIAGIMNSHSTASVALCVLALVFVCAMLCAMLYLQRDLITRVSYHKYPDTYFSVGTEVERRLLFPASRWEPVEWVQAFDPLLAPMLDPGCVLLVVEVALSCFVGAVAGVFMGGACETPLLAIAAALHMFYAVVLIAMRPHILPMDKVCVPLIYFLMGAVCMTLYFDRTSSVKDDLQVALPVVQIWCSVCNLYFCFVREGTLRESALAAAEEPTDMGVVSTEITRQPYREIPHSSFGPFAAYSNASTSSNIDENESLSVVACHV